MITLQIAKYSASLFALLSMLSNSAPIQMDNKISDEKQIAKIELSVHYPFEKMTVEERVKTYFQDIPQMVEVARCESQFRHNNLYGEVIRGERDKNDLGVMQINERYHLLRAMDLGYDINTIEGNMSYARNLYNEKGLTPWNASKSCWQKELALADTSSKTGLK